MPERRFVYVVDDHGFPYGSWEEENLRWHLLDLFSRILKKYNPALCVLACNTASTLALHDLRAAFSDYPFVGTVPAIKPAAQRSVSGLISVLATPGTVKRAYTKELIAAHACHCTVELVGSKRLAGFAEDYLRGRTVELEAVREEISPCFVAQDGKHTDIIVLACTHYPFLINIFRKLAPWPVDWLDPAEAIAQRARCLLPARRGKIEPGRDIACFTSGQADFATRRLLHGFGFKCDEPL